MLIRELKILTYMYLILKQYIFVKNHWPKRLRNSEICFIWSHGLRNGSKVQTGVDKLEVDTGLPKA
jgi:hypothetical protein